MKVVKSVVNMKYKLVRPKGLYTISIKWSIDEKDTY